MAYGGGHAQSLIPVIKILDKMNYNCVVLGASTGAVNFRASGIKCIDYTDLVHERNRDLVNQYGKKLLHDNYNPFSGLTREQSISYLGLNYLNNVVREGTRSAASLYFSNGRNCFLPLDSIETLIKDVQPDLVVTSISPRTELAARMVAAKFGIPTIAIADVINPESPSNPVIVDTLCVPNEFAKIRWAEKEYVVADNIVVTGNPAYDKLMDLPKVDRTSILFLQQVNKYNFKSKEREYFGEIEFYDHFDRWENIANELDCDCEVRLHPTIDKNIFIQWSKKKRRTIKLDTQVDIATSLASRKLVIGNFSTSLTEALYLNTPVLQYLYKGQVDTLDRFIEQGFVKSAYIDDEEEMVNIIRQISSGEIDFTAEFNRFRSHYPSYPAAPNIAEQILQF
ncbi:MAG: hypothetical protein AAF429_04100 [Pseudomonadota bacterium]